MHSFAIPTAVCALAATALAVNIVNVEEQEFVDSVTGQRFVILGIDYQPTYVSNGDPLSSPDTCLRDAALMQSIGINTIRVYNLEPSNNHDECVSIFNEAGIYMILDVNNSGPNESLDRDNPASTYDSTYMTHVFSMIEAFKSYPNLLGFFSGNEVMNTPQLCMTDPPYIRAVQRDMKMYIANHASRTIPVGYSADDLDDNLVNDQWQYLSCNNSQSGVDMSRSDFMGINDYQWCGDSSFTQSGYNVLVEMFANTTIPIFFSEYGCNKVEPRLFDEVPVLYGPQMTVLSGGLVFEWSQEVNDFGLAQGNSDGSLTLLPDYYTLRSQYNTLNLGLIESRNNSATNLPISPCNPDLLDGQFSTQFSPVAMPPGVADLISNGVSNPPTGSLISVSRTSVTGTVFATGGAQIQGLAISSVSAANVPNSSAGFSTTAAPSASSGATTSTTTGSSSSSPLPSSSSSPITTSSSSSASSSSPSPTTSTTSTSTSSSSVSSSSATTDPVSSSSSSDPPTSSSVSPSTTAPPSSSSTVSAAATSKTTTGAAPARPQVTGGAVAAAILGLGVLAL